VVRSGTRNRGAAGRSGFGLDLSDAAVARREEGSGLGRLYRSRSGACADHSAGFLGNCAWSLRPTSGDATVLTWPPPLRAPQRRTRGWSCCQTPATAPFGGATGDSVAIWPRMLRQNMAGHSAGCLSSIPPAGKGTLAAGEGARINLALGHALDPSQGKAVDVSAVVAVRSWPGRCRRPCPQGRRALLRVGAGVVACDRPARPHPLAPHAEFWTYFGVDADRPRRDPGGGGQTGSTSSSFADWTASDPRPEQPRPTPARGLDELAGTGNSPAIFPLDANAAPATGSGRHEYCRPLPLPVSPPRSALGTNSPFPECGPAPHLELTDPPWHFDMDRIEQRIFARHGAEFCFAKPERRRAGACPQGKSFPKELKQLSSKNGLSGASPFRRRMGGRVHSDGCRSGRFEQIRLRYARAAPTSFQEGNFGAIRTLAQYASPRPERAVPEPDSLRLREVDCRGMDRARREAARTTTSRQTANARG